MMFTISKIAQGIRDGSTYPPLRNHAAAVCHSAPRKDYLMQLRLLWDDFISRWRYVKDPLSTEWLQAGPKAMMQLTMGLNGGLNGKGIGAGDCDDSAIAMGALCRSTGFEVRICTTARGSFPMSHVFIQAKVPSLGWFTLDPVLLPKKGFGDMPDHSRIMYFDLNGRRINVSPPKNNRPRTGAFTAPSGQRIEKMYGLLGENDGDVQELGFAGLGLSEDGDGQPLADWSQHIVKGFGAYHPEMGFLTGPGLPPVEVTDEDIQTSGLGGGFRTPMLEVLPADYNHFKLHGVLPDDALALGDDGTIYQYSGLDGFFKKLFKRVRKGIKKIRGKIRKGIRKLLKRTKFGRIILKVRDKVVGVMMKIVKPLMKVVGKWAGKLAPIAAMIPGWGTVISAGLTIAGKVAKTFNKVNAVMKDVVSPDGKGGEIKHKKIFFKTPAHEAKFKQLLEQEAKEMSKKPKAELEAMAAKLKGMDPNKYSRSNAVTDEHAEKMVQVMKRARGGRPSAGAAVAVARARAAVARRRAA
jgi:hypothetical protein